MPTRINGQTLAEPGGRASFGVIVPSVAANERSQRRKRMAKFIRLDTKFEGPVYLDPEHIQVVCTPESDSPSPGVKVVLSSGIWFVVQGGLLMSPSKSKTL